MDSSYDIYNKYNKKRNWRAYVSYHLTSFLGHVPLVVVIYIYSRKHRQQGNARHRQVYACQVEATAYGNVTSSRVHMAKSRVYNTIFQLLLRCCEGSL